MITALTFASVECPAAQQVEQYRTFRSSDGKTIAAKLLSATENEATMVRDDGRSFTLSLTRLSIADQDYVKTWRKNQADGSGETPDDVKDFSAISLAITEPRFPGTPDFYQKEIEILGIPIQGSEEVSDAALRRAAEVIHTMLANDEVRSRMVRNKARVTILAESESLPDMPERAHLKGKTGASGRDYNNDLQGLGGTEANPVATAPEDNLLHLESDRKKQANVLVHEFGHSVMNLGLDDRQLMSVEDIYEEAMEKGLWKGAYASTNAGEYFAESTQCYFDAQQRNALDIRTRERLKSYDPAMHNLLQSIFGDRELPNAEARQ